LALQLNWTLFEKKLGRLTRRPVAIVTELPRLNQMRTIENNLNHQYATQLGLILVELNVLKLFTHNILKSSILIVCIYIYININILP